MTPVLLSLCHMTIALNVEQCVINSLFLVGNNQVNNEIDKGPNQGMIGYNENGTYESIRYAIQ